MVDVEPRKVSSQASTSKCGLRRSSVRMAYDWLWTPVMGTFFQAAPRDQGLDDHVAQLCLRAEVAWSPHL